MPESESARLLERLVKERHAALQAALRELDLRIALEDRDAKIAATQSCLAALDALCAVLSAGDQPPWMRQLRDTLNAYPREAARDQEAGRRLLERLGLLKPDIAGQTWGILAQGSAAVAFSSVYADYYLQSRLPELFDRLIAELQNVIDSGQVDSLRILQALDTLIATVRSNARDDILAAYGAIGFAKAFLRNFLFAALEEIPGIKPIVKALKETLDELDSEFKTTQTRANDRVVELVEAAVPVDFKYRPAALPAAEDEGPGTREVAS